MKNLIWIPVVLFFAFLFSCTKEGPAGPAGAAGGSSAKSAEFIVIPSAWQHYTSGSCTSACVYANIVDTAITADIISNGAIWVYWVNDTAGHEYVTPLPFSMSGDYGNAAMNCSSAVGIEQIYTENINVLGGNQTFKIVTLSGEMLHIHPELNKQRVPPYEEVKALVTGAVPLPQTDNKLTTIPKGN